jgi:hypothetical protein
MATECGDEVNGNIDRALTACRNSKKRPASFHCE